MNKLLAGNKIKILSFPNMLGIAGAVGTVERVRYDEHQIGFLKLKLEDGSTFVCGGNPQIKTPMVYEKL